MQQALREAGRVCYATVSSDAAVKTPRRLRTACLVIVNHRCRTPDPRSPLLQPASDDGFSSCIRCRHSRQICVFVRGEGSSSWARAILKRAVGPVVGGSERLSFDVLTGKMFVEGSPAAVPDTAIVEAVRATGMRAELWEQTRAQTKTAGRSLRTWLTAASGVLLALGFGLHAWLAGGVSYAFGSEGLGTAPHQVPVAARIAYALAAICGGWFVVPKAWYAARAMRPDMNLLMAIAVVGAIAIGEWFEGATVAFLFSVSLALESWSVGRARRAVEALLDLAPSIARVRRDDFVLELPPDQVTVGSILLVRPGERIPLDGVVRLGTSHVNQAPITGESVPVVKEPGGIVYAGTINGDGALEVETTKPAQDTTLAHIIKMVGEAQRKRGPAEQWVERFARMYTPAVLALAIAVAVLPPLLLGQSWGAWFYRALVLLVIGCPCALVISTPVTVVAGLAAAARQGVLIKGGAFLEAPARIKAVAVDKTGTLTEGKPRVTAVFPLAEHSEDELLARAAGMETHTDHPLAHAILVYAAGRKVAPLPVTDFQILQGKGATGRIDGREYWIGSHRYLEARGQETPDLHGRLEQLSEAGQTVVVVGNDQHVCGLIAIADAVRPDAGAVVHALHAAGVFPVVMLTGDNEPTARAIAAATGVDEVRAELLPEDKVKAVQDLVARYGQVAMVSDGVNDAPAMATATLGIAMGAIGSDAAIETADVALMADDLSKLPWLIRHSKRALSTIRVNIGLSLGVKALFVILTFAGFASLWAAIAADMGVSLVVIANALRLLVACA